MESKLTFETIRIPAADLGGENPFPDLQSGGDIHADTQFDNSVPKEERAYFNYGKVSGILPYRMQDQYNRNKKPREIPCVVLENNCLRAVFLPQYGGKLWSLYDKIHRRPLLHENPVFQPANLALRNAWTSGGVEWNIGMTGHTPYTLSPLYAATLRRKDGTPVLRMYEWERIRQVSYQLDVCLPENLPYLLIRVRLRNTRDEEVPIYWWSNMAVEETPDTRVLAPADKAFFFDYSRVLMKEQMPIYHGLDCSYTTRIPRAMDLFFDIPASGRKWEAALDGSGTGLVQTSTDRLQGRKLFMWGSGSGGRHWQEFLSAPGRAYLEIQAGLANTQMEHLPMPAGACWEWLEAYGCIQADPGKVHGDDWQQAYSCVEEQLEKDLPRQWMEEELKRLDLELDVSAPVTANGSGWAALELLRRGAGPCFSGEKAVFPDSAMGADQAPWKQLLETGHFPKADPREIPAAYLVQPEWRELLEKSVKSGDEHWHAFYQLGVMYAAAGDLDKAKMYFEQSFRTTPNGWALRCLAALLPSDCSRETAEKLVEAFRLLPLLPLAVECGKALLKAGNYNGYVDFFDGLPLEMQHSGRMQAMRIQAAIELEEFALAQEMLTRNNLEVSDMREGEILLSDLWVRLWMKKISVREGLPLDENLRARVLQEYPVPEQLDFRMKTE